MYKVGVWTIVCKFSGHCIEEEVVQVPPVTQGGKKRETQDFTMGKGCFFHSWISEPFAKEVDSSSTAKKLSCNRWWYLYWQSSIPWVRDLPALCY